MSREILFIQNKNNKKNINTSNEALKMLYGYNKWRLKI